MQLCVYSQRSHVALRVQGDVQHFGPCLDALMTGGADHFPGHPAGGGTSFVQLPSPINRLHLNCLMTNRVFCWWVCFSTETVPVDLIERMRPDRAVVGCPNKNLQRERLPLRVSTQLHRDTVWAVKSNCEEADDSETRHVTLFHHRSLDKRIISAPNSIGIQEP